jgi:hypothetical protein
VAGRPGPHTVGEVAKDLGRSVGAIGNALTTLADRAEAARLAGKPLRYEANSATATITPKTPAPPKPAAAASQSAASPAPPAAPKAPTPAPKGAPGPVTRPGGQVYRPRVLAGMADVEALRAEGVPALLSGPPGTGKTSLVEAAFPDLITVAGDAEEPDGTYEFIYGPLIRAMQEGRVLFINDATGCLVIWIPPATPRTPWPAHGSSSSPTPPPPARRSPARSPPAPAPPDRPPGGGPARLPARPARPVLPRASRTGKRARAHQIAAPG